MSQGYNNIEFPQQTQQQPMRPYVQGQKPQPAGTRIIPIQVEGGARATPQNENTIVMQR